MSTTWTLPQISMKQFHTEICPLPLTAIRKQTGTPEQSCCRYSVVCFITTTIIEYFPLSSHCSSWCMCNQCTCRVTIFKFYGILKHRLLQITQFQSLSWVIQRGGHYLQEKLKHTFNEFKKFDNWLFNWSLYSTYCNLWISASEFAGCSHLEWISTMTPVRRYRPPNSP